MADERHDVPACYNWDGIYFDCDDEFDVPVIVEAFVKNNNIVDEEALIRNIKYGPSKLFEIEYCSLKFETTGYSVTNWGWKECKDGSFIVRMLVDPHNEGKRLITAKHIEGPEKSFAVK